MILINKENYIVSHINESTMDYKQINALTADANVLTNFTCWNTNKEYHKYLHESLSNFISVPDVLFLNFVSVSSGDQKQTLDDIINIVTTTHDNSFTNNLKDKHNNVINGLINKIIGNIHAVYHSTLDFNKGKFYALAVRGGGSWIDKLQMYGKYEVITDEAVAVKLLLSGSSEDENDPYSIKKVLSYEEVTEMVGTNIEELFLS